MHTNMLDYIKTTRDVELLVEELDLVEDQMYKVTDKDLYDLLGKKLRSWVADIIVNGIVDRGSETEFIKELRDEVKKLPELRLTLAIDPSRDIIIDISDWARKNIDPLIILDISVDNSLVAGLTVDYKGEYGDYSIGEAINSIFEKRKDEFSSLLLS